MKAHQLQSLRSHQKVNHFPRSYELTRKDRLYKNIERVQRLQGFKYFDFIPQTFVLPGDYKELCLFHHRIRGPWIVKPVASSRGRGIYIVNSPDQIPADETLVVAKYIDDPLLVDGYKCDLRLYVAVTSYNPLVIYLYEEGLVRLATVKYESSGQHLWNPCMHLCNYSINKYHEDYIKSEDPEAEDVGHKWTLSALLRHLKSEGKDISLLMQKIEDVIIKAILSVTPTIVAAARFVPHPRNCFELYGFDILIDSTLKPWLLEVNLSPSLGCDSPLDVRIKSAMLTDLLTLIGLPVVDPMVQHPVVVVSSSSSSNNNNNINNNNNSNNNNVNAKTVRRVDTADNKNNKNFKIPLNLSVDDLRMINALQSEHNRRGGFLRIFPSAESWKLYSGLLDLAKLFFNYVFFSLWNPASGLLNLGNYVAQKQFNTHNYNLILHQKLFPDLDKCPVDRLPKYERALTQCSRRPLTAASIFASSNDKENILDHKYAKECKMELKKCMEKGCQLSTNQARRAFSQYLQQVLSKLGPPLEGPNTPAELCLKFLMRAAGNLRSPFFVKVPSNKLVGKDRVAVIAKQLNDYLQTYNRETELYYSNAASANQVPDSRFRSFLRSASETDVEEILFLHMKSSKCCHSFLGRCCSPSFTNLKFHSLLQVLPQLCAYNPSKPNECCFREVLSKTLPKNFRSRPSRSSHRSDIEV
ncbi:conserved hypothetical protein [Pediculus humanus corporis]|uniref:Tubulin--tyrosine ligase-like protein 5 n=1 Tax=Pediculus humanus subsp. corporis TaxID=121224 RepID=E0VML8_PEDHC|nr:uncharacterized protein Phum_PHUM313700 [Pediculus humanus corporis]EEB14624.1 conserved hypothetical protein [Pediculus humanus corporis]